MPQYRKGQPYSPGLYRAALPGRREGRSRSRRQRRRHVPARRDLAARQLQGRLPARLLPAACCAWTAATARRRSAASSTPTATRTTRTRPRTGPRFVPHDTRDVTLGVLSRLERALDRAGKAGAIPRGLPIYLTEFGIQSRPDRIQGVSFAKQAAYLLDRRAHGLRQPARALVLPVPDVRRQAARVGAEQVRRLRERPAHEQGQEEARLQGASGSRSRSRTTAARTSSGASCASTGRRPRSRSRSTRAASSGWRKLADVKTTGTGVYSLRGDAPQGPALPRHVDLAGRQALRRRRRALVLSAWTSVEPGRSSDWGPDPMGRQCGRRRSLGHHENAPDAPPRTRCR